MYKEIFEKTKLQHNVYYQDVIIGSCLVTISNKTQYIDVVNSPKNVKEINHV